MRGVKLLVAVLLLLPIASAECVPGIDDICDPNCVEVDFDCVENQYAGDQDLLCVVEPDGICQIGCEDADWDCFLEEQVIAEPTLQQERDAALEELEEFSSVLPLVAEEQLSTIEQVLLLIGALALCGLIYFFFHRLRTLHHQKKYADMIPYGQKALAQGFSQDQIKQSLEHRGYSKQYIKGYLKALEHKP